MKKIEDTKSTAYIHMYLTSVFVRIPKL